jgi:transposase
VAIDVWGIRLEDRSFPADSGGYAQLLVWAGRLGPIEAFGIEGTGSYGAGLTSAVRRAGHRVIEVNRGDRRARRANGSPTPSTPSWPPAPCWPASQRRCRRLPTERWR